MRATKALVWREDDVDVVYYVSEGIFDFTCIICAKWVVVQERGHRYQIT